MSAIDTSREAVTQFLAAYGYHGATQEMASRGRAMVAALLAERDALQGQIDAMRKDAERYQWLRANVQPWECGKYPYALLRIYMREGEKTIDYFQVGQGDGVGRISLDTAIDAAMSTPK